MYKPFAFNGFWLDEYIRIVSRMLYTVRYWIEHLNVMCLALCWLNMVPQQIALNKHPSIQPQDNWIWEGYDILSSHPYQQTHSIGCLNMFSKYIGDACTLYILKVCISTFVQTFKKCWPKYSHNMTYYIFKVDIPIIVSGWQKYWWPKISLFKLDYRLTNTIHKRNALTEQASIAQLKHTWFCTACVTVRSSHQALAERMPSRWVVTFCENIGYRVVWIRILF